MRKRLCFEALQAALEAEHGRVQVVQFDGHLRCTRQRVKPLRCREDPIDQVLRNAMIDNVAKAGGAVGIGEVRCELREVLWVAGVQRARLRLSMKNALDFYAEQQRLSDQDNRTRFPRRRSGDVRPGVRRADRSATTQRFARAVSNMTPSQSNTTALTFFIIIRFWEYADIRKPSR